MEAKGVWRAVAGLLTVMFGVTGALGPVASYAAEPKSEAQRLLATGHTADAIELLEANLPSARGDIAYLCLLRHAYRSYVRQLMREGRRQLAASFLKKLQLLEPASALECERASVASGVPPQPVPNHTGQTPVRLVGYRGSGPSSLPNTEAAHRKPSVRLGPIIEPAGGATSEADRMALLQRADRLFEEGRYEAAAPLYERACRNRTELPRHLAERWAYCRIRQVVRRINNGPGSSEEWETIEREAEQVLALVPGNRYVQFLRDLAASRGTLPIASAPVSPEVVRASSPEGPGGPAATVASLATRILAALHAKTDLRGPFRRFRQGRWQVLQTPSFVIYHMNPEQADAVARVAERARTEVYKTWFGREPAGPWQPKCVICLYPPSQPSARAAGQGPASPGHSATGLRGGRVVSRRIELRGDAPDLVEAVLPHEITHVVMADRYTLRPLPRWADEGIAILSEPAVKKYAHLRNLGRHVRFGPLFSAQQLMAMRCYPPGDMWGLFYAESVSLVDFLVQRCGPQAFL